MLAPNTFVFELSISRSSETINPTPSQPLLPLPLVVSLTVYSKVFNGGSIHPPATIPIVDHWIGRDYWGAPRTRVVRLRLRNFDEARFVMIQECLLPILPGSADIYISTASYDLQYQKVLPRESFTEHYRPSRSIITKST